MNYIFPSESVPISIVARVYKKDPSWVRAGIISGYLPIGVATRNGKKVSLEEWNIKHGRVNYYVSPKLLYEHTGYMWGGNHNGE